MAKLADITIHHQRGGAEFIHKFPCYVGSDGIFTVLTEGYDAELRAFVKTRKDIECDQDRQKRWRIAANNLKVLQEALSAFGEEMLEGKKETRLLILFDPRLRGTLTRSANSELSPHDWEDTTNRVMLSGGQFSSSHEQIEARPEIALVRVTRTITKSGTEAYSTNQIYRRQAIKDPEVGEAGALLVRWTPCHVGPDAWRQIKTRVIPYSEAKAAQINMLMERLAGTAYDLANFRDEDHGPLFSSAENN
ncbi:hypothetical protein P775_08240 [Puniceibacterium antarcticum]|uniref:Uncharacterized protein n=1 Tax=Puniceibacterium antarcticum TaxID=1206336 RepID=A0A2G8RHE5_9RHOB|nr:hypothetical protein [Puniceibacterium antarcticum]PIL20508.1 hypothetical protein P775_08240 [Puniceibacterium antarcticum]